MGFVAAILAGLVVIAVIGYFIIYAVTVLLLAMVGISCLGAYFLLVFLLGDDSAGMAMILAVPAGIGMAVLVFRSFRGET
jgi:hypothetical protein